MPGARPNILKDLIYELISIDQYEPKIQKDSIVVVFEVKENYDAAYDLSSFIERLPELTLDTEAAQRPNMSGNYEVYAEFERNADFPYILDKILVDIEKLANVQPWKVDVYGKGDVFDYHPEQIKEKVRLVPMKELNEFFEPSFVTASIINEGYNLSSSTLRTSRIVDRKCYFVPHETVSAMIQKYGIMEAERDRAILFPNHDVAKFVGTNMYVVEHNEKYLIIT